MVCCCLLLVILFGLLFYTAKVFLLNSYGVSLVVFGGVEEQIKPNNYSCRSSEQQIIQLFSKSHSTQDLKTGAK